jgi:UDP-N-acetylglucosamine transferase subunit ALG13
MAGNYNPNDVNAVLSRIETKMENKHIVDAERWQRMQRWMDLHQQECSQKTVRIEKLENWRWYVIGIVVGVGAVVGYFLKK